MHGVELVLISLLVAVSVLSAASRAIGVPYPIVLVLGGLVMGFIPGVPEVELDPELVLVIFLPPLLYSAAFFASLRDLKYDLRSISLMAIGLVIATACVVAVVAHALVEDHRVLIDERFVMHERRAAKLHGLVAERPRTAHELAQELWGNVAVTQAFLTLSEVLGHIDLLVDRGEADEHETGGVIRFKAV